MRLDAITKNSATKYLAIIYIRCCSTHVKSLMQLWIAYRNICSDSWTFKKIMWCLSGSSQTLKRRCTPKCDVPMLIFQEK